MITIIEALGKNYKDIVLEDNESIFGGTAHHNETLGEFMATSEIQETYDFGELCTRLEECGIKAPRPIKYINLSENPNNTCIDKYNKLGNKLRIYMSIDEWSEGYVNIYSKTHRKDFNFYLPYESAEELAYALSYFCYVELEDEKYTNTIWENGKIIKTEIQQ